MKCRPLRVKCLRSGRSRSNSLEGDYLRLPGPDRRRSGGRCPAYNEVEHFEYISVIEELAPRAMRMVDVGEEHDGQRLDNFLVHQLKGVPKSHLYKMIRSGEVRVNRGRASADARVHTGDQVRIPPVRTAAPAIQARSLTPPAPIVMPILWEDDELLAVDKPAGVAVHGGSGIAHGVIERLRASRPEARFLELVHRLDRGTSGVLLIAKRRPALLSLHAQLREGLTDKRYRAIVSGRWPLRSKRLDWPLVKTLTASGERMVYVRSDGQSAATIVTGLAHRDVDANWPMTLIEAKLETGRTHQIRVHCAHAGFPIIGDDRYGDFHLNGLWAQAGWRRMYLHAYQMTFKHPVSGQSTLVVAPQPPAFENLLQHHASFGPVAG